MASDLRFCYFGLSADDACDTLAAEDFIPAEVVSLDRTWGRGRSDAILRAVEQWTANGESGRQIAGRLGVTRRTVSRLRATCRERQVS